MIRFLRAKSAGLASQYRGMDRNFKFFLLANVFLGFGACIDASTFNNYLHDVYKLDEIGRTFLEFPRELPGFLSVFFVGMLFALGDIRIAALANIFVSVGMFALGIIPPVYGVLLTVVFIYSSGQHIFMPIANTIGMGFATDGKYGRKLGQISAANTAALVSGSLVLLVLFQFVHLSYFAAFTIGSISFFIASLFIFRISQLHTPPMTQRWVFRKEYGLFYWLSVLWGARKQLFLTFGPWVLVRGFGVSVVDMTMLFLITSALGIVLKPWIGSLIDRIGERPIMMVEAIILVGVCLLYATAADFAPPSLVAVVLGGCYIVDQSSSSVSMARSTYLRKIALKPQDVSPTLSLGITIDHIASMFLPMLGGLVWNLGGEHGYKYVFIGGAVIALVNWFSVRRIPKMA